MLEALKTRGVWLLDASPVALYAGAVVKEVSPRAVVVIGKTVDDVLVAALRGTVSSSTSVDWIYQPQARVSAECHRAGRETLARVVRAAGTQVPT